MTPRQFPIISRKKSLVAKLHHERGSPQHSTAQPAVNDDVLDLRVSASDGSRDHEYDSEHGCSDRSGESRAATLKHTAYDPEQ